VSIQHGTPGWYPSRSLISISFVSLGRVILALNWLFQSNERKTGSLG
jgi:hypothetical protein